LIYYALVYPYLTYGNLVWGNTYPTRLQNLLKIQKKIVRLMCFKSYTDHSEPLFFNIKILNIYKINDHLCSLFMYRCMNYNQNLPNLYNYYFIQNKNCLIIIRETLQTCTFVIKGRTIVFTLFLTREFPYGIVLMEKLKIKNRIFPLRKKQN
jgi:hypothetical protein